MLQLQRRWLPRQLSRWKHSGSGLDSGSGHNELGSGCWELGGSHDSGYGRGWDHKVCQTCGLGGLQYQEQQWETSAIRQFLLVARMVDHRWLGSLASVGWQAPSRTRKEAPTQGRHTLLDSVGRSFLPETVLAAAAAAAAVGGTLFAGRLLLLQRHGCWCWWCWYCV